MELGIQGKRALVLGGTSGLGAMASQALAAEGVHITLFARDQTKLEAAKRDIEAAGGKADICRGDVTQRDDLERLKAQLVAGGGLDILVLNSPRPPSPMREFLAETDDSRWQEAHTNQLDAMLLVLREITPMMLGKGWGRIVAITSASVKNPMPRHALSTIYRAGLQAALKHLANELAPEGITVNSVAPATIMTPTFGQFHDVTARINAVPLKRAGRPEELGATVAFLASDLAGFLTGQVLQLDGGQSSSLF